MRPQICSRFGASDVCEKRTVGGASYVHVVGSSQADGGASDRNQRINQKVDNPQQRAAIPQADDDSYWGTSIRSKERGSSWQRPIRSTVATNNAPNRTGKGPLVEMRKTAPGVRLALIRRLVDNQTKGVPYSAINAYLRKEFDAAGVSDNMGTSFIADMLTYDPRNDPAKSYADVLTALANSSENYNWLPFADIVDGLAWD
jgi:hypothetical protein